MSMTQTKHLHQNEKDENKNHNGKLGPTQDLQNGPHLLPRVRVRQRRLPALNLLDVLFVVEYFDVTTAWFVLNVVQGADFTLCFEFQLLVFDLSGRVNVQI